MDIKNKWYKRQPLHVQFACAVLFCFVLAKLGTVAARSMGYLPKLNIAEIPNERLMLAAGIGELVAIGMIMWKMPVRWACLLIAAIGIGFLIYRFQYYPVQCPCMGAVPDLIPWLKIHEKVILLTVPFAFVLLGMWGWLKEFNASKSE